jgi:hypothetical protein
MCRADFIQASDKPRDMRMARRLTWVDDGKFEGWTCSECSWTYPIPELLADPEAKNAFDRIASAHFAKHTCQTSAQEQKQQEGNMDRLRKLVMRGFKPKDAIEIMLEEVALECRRNPQTMEKARVDADEFLRQIREGRI